MIKIIAVIAMPLIMYSCDTGSQSNHSYIQELSRTVTADSASATIAEQNKAKEFNTEEYDNIVENQFVTAKREPLSTFSIDVDRAAYSNVRRIIQSGSLPPAGAVRIEEMVNYFNYNYPQPENCDPFSINTEISNCPWNTEHKLVHIGLQGKKIATDNLPASNLVFLIDVSGSMSDENKLPLVQSSLKMLTDQLRDEDNVAIVV